jgi:subtilisin family serine protease
LRRLLPFLALGAVLASAVPAAAALQPLPRTFGQLTVPRVRAGVLRVPSGQPRGRVRVIARLHLPPLAAAYGRRIAAAGGMRHLDVRTRSARAYLAQIATAQNRAVAQLRQAIPQARVGRRYRILLDGFAVTLPARRLPQLVRMRLFTRIYPSLRYTQELNRSPSVIGADTIRRVAGADGTGIKIAVVDDGVDQTNPFFDATGFQYPSGFPRGGLRWTSPKVIVAKVFPGPNSGKPGRLAVDPSSSFHGTHVAGIAAGDSGTTAPAGTDHPLTPGLSGVAPRAWLGNYRVFTVPTPIGHVANTPEILAAFEAAVSDGMDVINFSGGGPQTEPANDALVEAVRNVAAAGVVPVIAAGNDRDEFGLGSAGSPGTAPDAISVAAVSSGHVFSPALSVTAPGAPDVLKQIPFLGAAGSLAPTTWGAVSQMLVDVGSILGRDGRPVERHLCGPPSDLGSADGQLPAHSLDGTIALAQRGICPFVTKAAQARAAGAIGLILSDNRAGEANQIPLRLEIPSGMIADRDGDLLRSYVATTGGRTTIQVGRETLENVTGRSGVVTSFSSAGPTSFGHTLKPDIAAPGGQILSSTLPGTATSRFAVFDGTSMATPHIAGAAALLIQLHRTWTPHQVKSALVSTAGPAWGDTARTREASVLLEGGGLADLPRASDPKLFTEPVSLSFGDLNTSRGASSRALLVRLTDAGDGAGTWQVELVPQSTTAGTTIDVPGTIDVAPGGEADLAVVARAAAGATTGENYGFIVLRRGTITRRVPYLFVSDNPGLATHTAVPLKRVQTGDTRFGTGRVDVYRYPLAPFGNAPDAPTMQESGAEKVYVTHLSEPAVNLGVSVVLQSFGARIDPFLLGAQDENQVQGFTGTPIDVNALTYDFLVPIGAAGSSMPRPQTYYVAVDSGVEPYTNRSLAGSYILRAWVNDVTPPTVRLLSRRVSAGRPTFAVKVTDAGAGVDPYSLTIGYGRTLVGAAAYDPLTGIAVFPLPSQVAKLKPGTRKATLQASDFQESKNVNTTGPDIMPNTNFAPVTFKVVNEPTVGWLLPAAGACVRGTASLVVTAGSPRAVRSVRFLDGGRVIGTDSKPQQGLSRVTWRTQTAKQGPHTLEAVVKDAAGRTASARRVVRVCR